MTLPTFFDVLELLLAGRCDDRGGGGIAGPAMREIRSAWRTRPLGDTTWPSAHWATTRSTAFRWMLPRIEVGTTDGYRPGLRKIVAFVNDRG